MSESTEKKSRGCRRGCLIVALVAGGLMVLAVVALILSAHVSSGGKHHLAWAREDVGEDEMPMMQEIWSSGTGDVKVVRIPVTGMISLNEGGGAFMGDSSSAVAALRAIRRATHDPDVSGIILEIDSGGGGITASDIIYKALKDFKAAKQGRAIVSLMGDVAASGAYYISLPSDVIMAHPTTITGSIGVIMQGYNIQELAAKIGLKDVTFKSGENKDLMNPFHDVSPAQRAMLQAIIDSMYDRFVMLVAQARQLPESEVRKLADGRIFVASDALKAKLIDDIGYNADAERAMTRQLGVSAIRVIRYEEETSFMDLLRNRRGLGMSLESMLAPRETRLMYRWEL